jgi:recombination protein RecR
MAAQLPRPVQDVIDAFTRLPGIGPKMAARLTFYLLQKSSYDVGRFIDALDSIRTGLQSCQQCGHITDKQPCIICRDESRNPRTICVVEGSLDVIALDKTGTYNGVYHVLGGALSPIDGIGPDQLRIDLLHRRLLALLQEKDDHIEVILATNPSLEGEATAQYLGDLLETMVLEGKITLSRIARGLPMGSDLEYADPTTLARALEGRKDLLPSHKDSLLQ